MGHLYMNPQGSWRVFVDGDWQQQHVQIKAQAPTAEELNELEKELLRMSSLKMASPSPKSGRNYIDDKPILPSSIATPFQGSNGDKPSGDGVGDVDVGGNGGSIMGASGPPSLSGRASPRRLADKKGGKKRQQGVLDKQAVAARYIQSLESSFQAYLESSPPPPAPVSLGSASSGSSLGTKDQLQGEEHAAAENTQILDSGVQFQYYKQGDVLERRTDHGARHRGSVILHFNDPSPPTSESKKDPPSGPTSGSLKRV